MKSKIVGTLLLLLLAVLLFGKFSPSPQFDDSKSKTLNDSTRSPLPTHLESEENSLLPSPSPQKRSLLVNMNFLNSNSSSSLERKLAQESDLQDLLSLSHDPQVVWNTKTSFQKDQLFDLVLKYVDQLSFCLQTTDLCEQKPEADGFFDPGKTPLHHSLQRLLETIVTAVDEDPTFLAQVQNSTLFNAMELSHSQIPLQALEIFLLKEPSEDQLLEALHHTESAFGLTKVSLYQMFFYQNHQTSTFRQKMIDSVNNSLSPNQEFLTLKSLSENLHRFSLNNDELKAIFNQYCQKKWPAQIRKDLDPIFAQQFRSYGLEINSRCS